jgi:hypothetical protein
VRYVATTPRPDLVDTLELTITRRGGKEVIVATATILGGLDVGLSPAALTARRGGTYEFALTGLPADLDPREVTAIWRGTGLFGLLDGLLDVTTERYASELVTYVCTSAPTSGVGTDTITCDIFLHGERIGSVAVVITVEGQERPRDPVTPPPTPMNAPAPGLETWRLNVTSVGTWEDRRFFLHDSGTFSGPKRYPPREATETVELTFVLRRNTHPSGDGVSFFLQDDASSPYYFSFSLLDRGATSSPDYRGSFFVSSKKQRKLLGYPELERRAVQFSSYESNNFTVDLPFREPDVTVSPDGRVISGTITNRYSRFALILAPDQQLALGERVDDEYRNGSYLTPYWTFLSKETSFTLTRLSD